MDSTTEFISKLNELIINISLTTPDIDLIDHNSTQSRGLIYYLDY